MDTSRFNSTRDTFPILDLAAEFAFKSATSIGFSLGRSSRETEGPLEGIVMREQLGWVDVHHPCNDHIKTQIVCRVPREYHTWEKQQAIVDTVLLVLGIPWDETYEARFFHAGETSCLEQATDRDGETDRLNCFRRTDSTDDSGRSEESGVSD